MNYILKITQLKMKKDDKRYKVDDQRVIIDEIMNMRLLELKSKSTVVKFLKNKYKISDNQCYLYIKKTESKIAEIYDNKIEFGLELAISKLESIQEKALIKDDLKLALATEIELSKLKGLYTIKIEQSIKEDIPLFSDDDLDENENEDD